MQKCLSRKELRGRKLRGINTSTFRAPDYWLILFVGALLGMTIGVLATVLIMSAIGR